MSKGMPTNLIPRRNGQWLKTHKLTKLTQEEITNFIGCLTIEKIESVTINLPRKKSPGPDGFTSKF